MVNLKNLKNALYFDFKGIYRIIYRIIFRYNRAIPGKLENLDDLENLGKAGESWGKLIRKRHHTRPARPIPTDPPKY